ncbi:hypothetical protein LEP1GSC036_0320 [Leptospira weilii str. 2006001853]|uniref:Uncharacterized protein n=1 Tax=Leptospira weilii str. 2006001853 TaxID=1001589 RepID=A0A828Z4A5_9LEPT|nr:hypothetical protein LEP1GSC036_0320 [Leptospira weilii str. 2006001853]
MLSVRALLCCAKNQRLRFAAFGYLASGNAEKLVICSRSSLLRKEPSITLRYLRLSRFLRGAHLCYAKNLRSRSAIYGYLAS